MKRASLRSALFTGLTLALLSGCTSMRSAPNDPLDAGEWRSAKSRMYQDLAMQCLRAQDHDHEVRGSTEVFNCSDLQFTRCSPDYDTVTLC